MTVRTGRSCVVETFDQFRNRLDVEWSEVIRALPEDDTARRLAEQMQESEDADLPIDSVGEWHPMDLPLHVQEMYAIGELIEMVLDERDQEYTYVSDVSIHRIIELDERDD